MRQIMAENHFRHKKGMRRRGHEVQRIEVFTDTVFTVSSYSLYQIKKQIALHKKAICSSPICS